MNFFNRKTTWTNGEFIPLKLCIASAYILVGACFHDFVYRNRVIFILLFIVTVIFSVYSWIKKMSKENK
ncbi:hypothetical protein [Pedobacter sp.]|uniref:hypothetical protein n=1 Tax=Pedobacter sp. TaxID=1411316 RepID=UPI00396C9725